MKYLPGLSINSRSIIDLKCITQHSHLIVKISNAIHLMRKVIINKSLVELDLIHIYNNMDLGISLRYIRRRLQVNEVAVQGVCYFFDGVVLFLQVESNWLELVSPVDIGFSYA